MSINEKIISTKVGLLNLAEELGKVSQVFVGNEAMEVDNNLVENVIRPIKLGLMNGSSVRKAQDRRNSLLSGRVGQAPWP